MDLHSQRIALLFPGQGSQAVGMGRLLAVAEAIAAKTFAEADDLLGFPLSQICWQGPAEALNDTINTQPALLTHSIALLRTIQSHLPSIQPVFVAGHSVGEISALVASNALSFPDALLLVRERGRLMKEVGRKSPGGMAAILGLSLEQVESICQSLIQLGNGAAWVANDNCPGQVVIAGDEQGLQLATEQLLANGARKVVRLQVSIPSHCPLMTTAQAAFTDYLRDVAIKDPEVPVINNVNAEAMQRAQEVHAELSAQLISRVRWRETIDSLKGHAVSLCLEIGPGRVLSGLMRHIADSPIAFATDIPAGLPAIADLFTVIK